MLKLLIADTSEEFTVALTEELRKEYSITACANGKEVLNILRSDMPDVLVLDLVLPELDGITLLQQAAREHIMPVVLATSSFYNDYVIASMEAVQVAYVMRRPCDIRATADRIRDLSQQVHAPQISRADPRSIVTDTLLQMGFQPGRKGYPCLRESILLMSREQGQSITKEIYPEVGEMLGGNSEQVEHAIRSAIKKAWKTRDAQIWERYFPPDGAGKTKCPTNKLFICRMADMLELNGNP